jgi:hypothetical protein
VIKKCLTGVDNFDVSTSYISFYGCHSGKVERDVRSTLTSSVAMATEYVHNKMAAATCYTYTGAIRKKLREMSGVQLRHQYVLRNTKKKINGLNNK